MRSSAVTLFATLVIHILMWPAHAGAADITGTYTAQGGNPGGKGTYKGTVIITKSGETYKVVWSVGTAYIGTGILWGDVLSVAYVDENRTWFGIVAYKVSPDGRSLEGKWCGHQGQALGTETLVKR